MKSFLNYSKNRILYNIFRGLLVFSIVFLLNKCDVKALEQNYSIDLYSFTYGGLMGDLNTGCSFQTKTQTLTSNFTQYIDFYSGGYCDTTPSGMTIGMNVTTNITAGSYYTITQTLLFEGSIQYLQEKINLYTQCGVYTTSGWNMSACDDVVVTATPAENGSANIIYTFKPKVNGTKYTFTVGSLEEGYRMFYAVGNGGRFRMTSLKVDKSDDPILGVIGSLGQQNNTIINQNQTIIDQNTQTNDKLEGIQDALTDSSQPNTSDLENSAGWLPAGPVDSILNLPLTLFQSLLDNLGSSCAPVVLPIPYVNKNLTLPCFNSIAEQIRGFSVWWNGIGVIASAFILYSYLLKLYKWVDDTLTFRENTWQDWGGV